MGGYGMGVYGGSGFGWLFSRASKPVGMARPMNRGESAVACRYETVSLLLTLASSDR